MSAAADAGRPSDWVIVRRHPTPAMRAAGATYCQNSHDLAHEAWARMVAVSPEPDTDARRPTEAEVEAGARALCQTAGVDPDALFRLDGWGPVPQWRFHQSAARAVLTAARPAPTPDSDVSRLRADLELAQSIAGGEISEREWLSQAEIGSLKRALAAEKAEVSRLLAQVATLTTALDATADALATTEGALGEARAAAIIAFAAVCEARGYEVQCGNPTGLAHHLIIAGKALSATIAPTIFTPDERTAK